MAENITLELGCCLLCCAALAVSFVPASCLDICWYLHRMLKRNGYREKSAGCSHLGLEVEGSRESSGCSCHDAQPQLVLRTRPVEQWARRCVCHSFPEVKPSCWKRSCWEKKGSGLSAVTHVTAAEMITAELPEGQESVLCFLLCRASADAGHFSGRAVTI